jgi:hypothetical protein
VDSSAVSRTDVVVDMSLALRMSLREYTHKSEHASTRNCRSLSWSVTKKRPVVVAQTCAAVDFRCVSSPAGGRRRAEYTFVPGSEAAMVPAEDECSIISGGDSAARTAVPGAVAGIPGAGAKAVLLGADCCQLAGEVLDPLQKYGVVGGGVNQR